MNTAATSSSGAQRRVVLVTGGTKGIGRAIAEAFLAAGDHVIVCARNAADALPRSGAASAEFMACDVKDLESVKVLFAGIVQRHGRLDVLVNNAGWTARVDHRDLDALTDEIFRKTFEVNVFGTWYLTKAAMPHLKAVEDGNVVTVSSVAGVRPVGSSMAYAMSKAALNHMTLCLAKSHGPVRVNAIAPGLVVTPWTEEWKDLHEGIAAVNPVPRIAMPDDCAEAVLALVRNRYVSGEVMLVDGGFAQRF